MTLPVLPTDAEIDYLATQIAAEFLEQVATFDGLIYQSSQCPGDEGVNIVLFNGMSAVSGDKHSATDAANPANEPPPPEPVEHPFLAFVSPIPDTDGAKIELRKLWQEPMLELIEDSVITVRIGTATYNWTGAGTRC